MLLPVGILLMTTAVNSAIVVVAVVVVAVRTTPILVLRRRRLPRHSRRKGCWFRFLTRGVMFLLPKAPFDREVGVLAVLYLFRVQFRFGLKNGYKRKQGSKRGWPVYVERRGDVNMLLTSRCGILFDPGALPKVRWVS